MNGPQNHQYPSTDRQESNFSFRPVPHLSQELNEQYVARREQALCSIASLVRMGTFPEHDLREAADHMHKLAGTAAMFGEAELGLAAKKLEDGITNWSIAERPDALRKSVENMLNLARSGGNGC